MPFSSNKQRALLYAKKPEVAKKFAAHGKKHGMAKGMDAAMDVIKKKLKK